MNMNKIKTFTNKLKSFISKIINLLEETVNNKRYYEYVVETTFWIMIVFVLITIILNGYDYSYIAKAKIYFADTVILLSTLPFIFRKDK